MKIHLIENYKTVTGWLSQEKQLWSQVYLSADSQDYIYINFPSVSSALSLYFALKGDLEILMQFVTQ